MYGSPADARRQPSPQAARHGHGRPPDGGEPQGVARAIARTIFSYVGWSPDQAAALPPLSPSAADADADTGLSVGAVQRQPATAQDPEPPASNAYPPFYRGEPYHICMGKDTWHRSSTGRILLVGS